ncbi:MAG: hypothetical protein AB7G15_19530 [Alphaproteobacteria bacterium]
MKTLAKWTVLAATGLLAFDAVSAAAQSTATRTMAGTELRVSGRHERSGTRDHIWKLGADGVARGVYSSAQVFSAGIFFENGSDVGQWTADGNRLCVTWSNWTRGQPACYTVTYTGGNGITLRNESTGDTLTGQIDSVNR